MKIRVAVFAIFAAILLTFPMFVEPVQGQPAPRRIEVVAKRFQFLPSEITLKKGEPVVLVLKSVDVSHGIRIKELGIDRNVDKGQTGEVVFTPTKTGTFVGHCSVFCGSGHGGMTLTLHVVD